MGGGVMGMWRTEVRACVGGGDVCEKAGGLGCVECGCCVCPGWRMGTMWDDMGYGGVRVAVVNWIVV